MSKNSEIAFLPAALEIQETPPSPTGRSIIWIIVLFFLAAWIWAWFGHVDIVAVAQGRIIPSGHSKVVQPLVLGTVTAINVEEGQAVQAGEVLMTLDASSAEADVARLTDELNRAKQDITRLSTLSDWLTSSSISTDDDSNPLLLSQWQEFQDQIAVLGRERDRKTAERNSAMRQLDKLADLLHL